MICKKKSILWGMGLGLAVIFCGCSKIDTLPQLEIMVVDENEAVVPGVTVGLFDNEVAWTKRENPVQVWRQTGIEGKVVFTDLKEVSYYIYARLEEKDNSMDEILTTEQLRLNQKNKIVIHIR
ncbi:MAG: hypothetical protein PHY99_03255 [Bacteroidales bacterium]|nr:hypothetical protein [Bacteroidales bacterium]